MVIREDEYRDIKEGDRFRLVLPWGVIWNSFYEEKEDVISNVTYKRVSDNTIEFAITGDPTQIEIPLSVKVDGAEGELKVFVEGLNSPITSGQYTFAIASGW